jgi:hypothetical protein
MAKQPSKSAPADSSGLTPDERREARRHIVECARQLRLDTPTAVCQNVAGAIWAVAASMSEFFLVCAAYRSNQLRCILPMGSR